MGSVVYLSKKSSETPDTSDDLPQIDEVQAALGASANAIIVALNTSGTVARCIEIMQRNLETLAYFGLLIGKIEQLEKSPHPFDCLVGSPVDPSFQTMLRREIASFSDMLFKAASEFALQANLLALAKTELERVLSERKATA